MTTAAMQRISRAADAFEPNVPGSPGYDETRDNALDSYAMELQDDWTAYAQLYGEYIPRDANEKLARALHAIVQAPQADHMHNHQVIRWAIEDAASVMADDCL